MLRLALPLVLMIGSCTDETLSGYADPGAVYVLGELDGAAFGARATLTFPEAGRIAGEAPCNSYSAELAAPLPWFSLGPITATERGCSDLALEAAFFGALQTMSLAEVAGRVLILSDDAGREMVFGAE